MKVLNIETNELQLIDEALAMYQESIEEHLDMLEDVDKEEANYDIAHIKTTRALLKRQNLQKLCERCLSYFWDRIKAEGVDNEDVKWLVEEMGVDEEELQSLFIASCFD